MVDLTQATIPDLYETARNLHRKRETDTLLYTIEKNDHKDTKQELNILHKRFLELTEAKDALEMEIDVFQQEARRQNAEGPIGDGWDDDDAIMLGETQDPDAT